MNTSTKILSSALIAIASLSAASAFAGDSDFPGVQTNTASTTTRAQVQADLLQARRQGNVMPSDDIYPAAVAQDRSGKTREEVKAELGNALQHGFSPRIERSYPGSNA